MTEETVSVVITSRNSRNYILSCLHHLAAQTRPPDEILLVDRGSTDLTADLARSQYPGVTVVQSRRDLGLGRSQNEGIRRSSGDCVLLLYAEVQLGPAYLEKVLGALAAGGRPRTGSASGKMYRMFGGPNVIEAAGLVFDTEAGSPVKRGEGAPDRGGFEDRGPVFGPAPGAALYRRATLADVSVQEKYLDESLGWLDEFDLAWRAQIRGWQSLYVPEATAVMDAREGKDAEAALLAPSLRYLQMYKNLRGSDLGLSRLLLREMAHQARSLLRSPVQALGLPHALGLLPHMRRKRQLVQKGRRRKNASLSTLGFETA